MTYNHFKLIGATWSEPVSVRRITNPATYCVSIEEVRGFMRVQTTSDDFIIESMIKAAESYAENYTKSAICRQQWQVKFDGFYGHDGEIKLPRAPLSTNTSDVTISYIEDTTAGNTTALASTLYTVDYYSRPGVVYPSYDNDWPEPRDERNAVVVTYWSGYSTPASVPDPIKAWVKLRVASMYENRESLMVGTGNFISELPHSYVDGLLDEFIVE
jgi:uncharacterized phiE125 gp8 family phage protein